MAVLFSEHQLSPLDFPCVGPELSPAMWSCSSALTDISDFLTIVSAFLRALTRQFCP